MLLRMYQDDYNKTGTPDYKCAVSILHINLLFNHNNHPVFKFLLLIIYYLYILFFINNRDIICQKIIYLQIMNYNVNNYVF